MSFNTEFGFEGTKKEKKKNNFPEPQEIKRDQKRRVRWEARVGQYHAQPPPRNPLAKSGHDSSCGSDNKPERESLLFELSALALR